MSETDFKQIIVEGLKGTSNVITANTLGYIKAGVEAFKNYEIPVFNEKGECNTLKRPYYANGVREFVDFMIIFLDESIKELDKQLQKEVKQ